MKRRSKPSARGAAPAPAAPPPTVASSTSSRARRSEIEADEPSVDIDDRDSCAVYADWLIERGDPLGELIAAHLRGADRTAVSVLELDYIGTNFPFKYDGDGRVEPSWRNGLFETLSISTHLGVQAMKAVGTTRAARCLRELRISVMQRTRGFTSNSGPPDMWDREPEEPADYPDNPIPTALKYPLPPTLRKLDIHLSLGRPDNKPPGPFDLTPLCPQLSKLEVLRMNTHRDGIGQLDLPSLRSLQTPLFYDSTVRDLGQAKLPNLEELEITSGEWQLLAKLEMAAPKLQHLIVGDQATPPYGPGFDAVVASPLTKRVSSLTFRGINARKAPDLLRVAPDLRAPREVRVQLLEDDAATKAELERILGPRLVLLPKWP